MEAFLTGALVSEVATQTAKNGAAGQDVPSIQQILDRYRAAGEIVAGYMGRAVALLKDLYAEQDGMIEQLKRLLSRSKSLRHSDFDAISANLLARRHKTREMLSTLVDGYRANREALIREIEDLCSSDASQASKVWPALKKRLLDGKDTGEGEVVAVLRQVHMEREELSAALSDLLSRGERLKINDLKTVVQRLASRDSRESAELAALLATCEAAGRNAGMQWQKLAG